MKTTGIIYKILMLPLLLQLITVNSLWSQQELWMSSSDANIQKRALKQGVPAFQIPVGATHLDNMELIGPGKLLVGLCKDSPGVPNLEYLLIDTNRGEVIWRYPRDKGDHQIYLIFNDLLLIRVEKGKATDFLAIDPSNGSQKWERSFKSKNVSFLPVLPSGQVWAINSLSKELQLTAFSIKDGKTIWESQWDQPKSDTPMPIVNEKHVFTFFNGLEALDSKTGEVIYQKHDIKLNEESPPLAFSGPIMYLITKDKQLVAIESATGMVKWREQLSDDITFTNVYPSNGILYLRGMDTDGKRHLIAVSAKNGREVWTYKDDEVLLSNLITYEGKLFFGTTNALKAVNITNGNRMFAVKVTETGRNYPITIREMDGNIIFIGELVIAAYDAGTGALRYKHGITPLGPDLHLNGLDAALPNLKNELVTIKGGSSPGVANMLSYETRNYQNMANKHYSDYQSYKNSGDYFSSEDSYQKYRSSSEMAKTQSMLAMSASIMELGMAIGNAIKAAAVKASIDEQTLFRKSILKVYSRAVSRQYVYRPNMIYHDADDQYASLSMIHLTSGKIRNTYLSPVYRSYGLWNLVDFENKMIYHHGIGMDTSLYKWSEPRRYPIKKKKTVETFIIGMPIEFIE